MQSSSRGFFAFLWIITIDKGWWEMTQMDGTGNMPVASR